MWNKYGAKKTECYQNHRHDSKVEAKYCDQLELRKKAGDILDYQVQVPFVLQEGFEYKGEKVRKIVYKADFYVINTGKPNEIIDVKGGRATQTQAFKIKWKMLKHELKDEGVILKIV